MEDSLKYSFKHNVKYFYFVGRYLINDTLIYTNIIEVITPNGGHGSASI